VPAVELSAGSKIYLCCCCITPAPSQELNASSLSAFWSVSDNAVAVLASNRGAPRHPDWYYNLVAHPTTTVEIGAETWSVRAPVAAPEERRNLTDRLVAESPSVASAVSRTSRQIPVVILELLARV
jgi:deazaflavin-dependent oxidoreductase (nitroreductase family)